MRRHEYVSIEGTRKIPLCRWGGGKPKGKGSKQVALQRTQRKCKDPHTKHKRTEECREKLDTELETIITKRR